MFGAIGRSSVVAALACVVAGVLMAGSAQADQTVSVPGTANIFGAGHAVLPTAGGGAGTPPPSVGVSPGAVVSFANVTGQVTCTKAATPNGPDGGHPGTCGVGTDISSAGGISGVVDAQAGFFLVGVFLSGAEPRDPAPPRLDFSSRAGALSESFSTLAPLLGQVFYVGDGLTGTGTGAVQRFRAPAGATRLFLGIADAYAFHGPPGYYGDNGGSISAVVRGGTAATPAGPVLGRSVTARAVSGTVLVKLPGAGFVPLGQVGQIPVGSILDTTGGTVALTTATGRPRAVQTGQFGAGVFQILQSPRQAGLTELHLITDRRTCVTRGGGRARTAAKRRLPRRVLNVLRANARGRFRTRGVYSSATVRGTNWDTVDRCDGTLTRVSRGVVSVRDLRRARTITLRAGQSYLAQA